MYKNIFIPFAVISILLLTFLLTGCFTRPISANDYVTQNNPLENNEEGSRINKEPVLAFPGADGGGKYTTGGRGGMVIKVTNLNDSGPGSLREALRNHEPRIVVFEVSGTIELKEQLVINHGNITIAGQTAPGDGICIKNYGFRVNDGNVIIRYMRFRPGADSNTELDSFTAIRQKDIIVDHCSMSWSTDETVSIYDVENTTLQWCIVSESLNESVHSKGAHGYGGIWGGKNTSFLNNILAHHVSRNPRLQGTRYQREENMELAELVNNLVYNWGNKAIYGGENGNYNIINNIFIPGPATRSASREEILESYSPSGQFYLSGNILINQTETVPVTKKNVSMRKETTEAITQTPFEIINAASAIDPMIAYEQILAGAGASHQRDEVDQRIVNDIRNRSYTYGTAGIIDSPHDAKGWPELVSKTPEPDSDNDGMPDTWEIKNGLDPHNPDDNKKYTLHPKYTNIEIYLNELVK